MNIGDILKQKLEAYARNPQEAVRNDGKKYQKDWNFAVKCFQERINKDRKAEGKPLVAFMAVRMKLVALREISDLKWLYLVCLKYSKTKDKQGNQNTFAKCFFGSLKVK
jgi:hypothetical protein